MKDANSGQYYVLFPLIFILIIIDTEFINMEDIFSDSFEMKLNKDED